MKFVLFSFREFYSTKEPNKIAPVIDTLYMNSFNNFKEITDKLKDLPEGNLLLLIMLLNFDDCVK